MTTPRILGAVLVAALILAPIKAIGEPPPTKVVRLKSPARVASEGGTVLDLPPDWVLVDPSKWEEMDAETRRLQDAETRLGAENKKLREAVGGGSSTFWWVLGASVTAFAAGAAWEKLHDGR